MRRLVIIGAGGMGRELFVAARQAGREPAGIVDDDPSPDNQERMRRIGAKWIGTVDEVCQDADKWAYLLGVGSPAARRRLDARLTCTVADPFIDPNATIGDDVAIGMGTVICAKAVLTTHVRIGRHVIVNAGAMIMHDTEVDDFATIGPNTTLCGNVRIDQEADLGAGVTAIPRAIVGANAVIGGGAVVVGSIPADVTAKGVPARWNV